MRGSGYPAHMKWAGPGTPLTWSERERERVPRSREMSESDYPAHMKWAGPRTPLTRDEPKRVPRSHEMSGSGYPPLDVDKYSSSSHLMNCSKTSFERTELLEQLFWTNYTSKRVHSKWAELFKQFFWTNWTSQTVHSKWTELNWFIA